MVFTNPINSSGYRLIPENPDYCSGNAPYIGYKSGASCIGQTEGKLWPRKAANLGWNTAVRLYVKNSSNIARNFYLQAIYINSGVAEIVANRPGIGWWVWSPLNAGSRWTWPAWYRRHRDPGIQPRLYQSRPIQQREDPRYSPIPFPWDA